MKYFVSGFCFCLCLTLSSPAKASLSSSIERVEVFLSQLFSGSAHSDTEGSGFDNPAYISSQRQSIVSHEVERVTAAELLNHDSRASVISGSSIPPFSPQLPDEQTQKYIQQVQTQVFELSEHFQDLIRDYSTSLTQKSAHLQEIEAQLLLQNQTHSAHSIEEWHDLLHTFKKEDYISLKLDMISDEVERSRLLRNATVLQQNIAKIESSVHSVDTFLQAQVNQFHARSQLKIMETPERSLLLEAIEVELHAPSSANRLQQRSYWANKLLSHDLNQIIQIPTQSQQHLNKMQREVQAALVRSQRILNYSVTSQDMLPALQLGVFEDDLTNFQSFIGKKLLRSVRWNENLTPFQQQRLLDFERKLGTLARLRSHQYSTQDIDLFKALRAFQNLSGDQQASFYRMVEEISAKPLDYEEVFNELDIAMPTRRPLSEANRRIIHSALITTLSDLKGKHVNARNTIELMPLHITKQIKVPTDLFEFDIAQGVKGHITSAQFDTTTSLWNYTVETHSKAHPPADAIKFKISDVGAARESVPVQYQVHQVKSPLDFAQKMQKQWSAYQKLGAAFYFADHDLVLAKLRINLWQLLEQNIKPEVHQFPSPFKKAATAILRNLHQYAYHAPNIYLVQDIQEKIQQISIMDSVLQTKEMGRYRNSTYVTNYYSMINSIRQELQLHHAHHPNKNIILEILEHADALRTSMHRIDKRFDTIMQFKESMKRLLKIDKKVPFLNSSDHKRPLTIKNAVQFEIRSYLNRWVQVMDQAEVYIQHYRKTFAALKTSEQQLIQKIAQKLPRQNLLQLRQQVNDLTRICAPDLSHQPVPKPRHIHRSRRSLVAPLCQPLKSSKAKVHPETSVHTKTPQPAQAKVQTSSIKGLSSGLFTALNVGGAVFDIYDLAYGAYLVDQAQVAYTEAESHYYQAQAIQSFANIGAGLGYPAVLMAAQWSGWSMSVPTLLVPVALLTGANMITNFALSQRYQKMSDIEQAQLYLHQLHHKYTQSYADQSKLYAIGKDAYNGHRVLWPVKDEDMLLSELDLTGHNLKVKAEGTLFLTQKTRGLPFGLMTSQDKYLQPASAHRINVREVLLKKEEPFYKLAFQQGATQAPSITPVSEIDALVLPTSSHHTRAWQRKVLTTKEKGIYTRNDQIGASIALHLEHHVYGDWRSLFREDRHISHIGKKTRHITPVTVKLPSKSFDIILPVGRWITPHLAFMQYKLKAPTQDQHHQVYRIHSHFFATTQHKALQHKHVQMHLMGGHAKTLWHFELPTTESTDRLELDIDERQRIIKISQSSTQQERYLTLHISPEAQGHLWIGTHYIHLNEDLMELEVPDEALAAQTKQHHKSDTLTEYAQRGEVEHLGSQNESHQAYTLYFSNASHSRAHITFEGLDETLILPAHDTQYVTLDANKFEAIQALTTYALDTRSGSYMRRIDRQTLDEHSAQHMICFHLQGHFSNTFRIQPKLCDMNHVSYKVGSVAIHRSYQPLSSHKKYIYKIDHGLSTMQYKRLSLDNQSKEPLYVTLRYRLKPEDEARIHGYDFYLNTIPQSKARQPHLYRLALLEPLSAKTDILVRSVKHGNRADFMIPEGARLVSLKAEFMSRKNRLSSMVNIFDAVSKQTGMQGANLKDQLLNQPFTDDLYLDLSIKQPRYAWESPQLKIQETTLEKREQSYFNAYKRDLEFRNAQHLAQRLLAGHG